MADQRLALSQLQQNFNQLSQQLSSFFGSQTANPQPSAAAADQAMPVSSSSAFRLTPSTSSIATVTNPIPPADSPPTIPSLSHTNFTLPPPPPTTTSSHSGLTVPPPPPPPITERYQSVRAGGTGHPSSATPRTTASTQPFLGMGAISAPFSTSHANQARLAHAATSIPRGPPLVPRQSRRSQPSRPRGPAILPPATDGPKSLQKVVSACVVEDSTIVRVTAKILPPPVSLLLISSVHSTVVDPPI